MTTGRDLRLVDDDGSKILYDGSGGIAEFVNLGTGYYRPPPGVDATLRWTGTGYELREHATGRLVVFSPAGLATRLEDRTGNRVTFGYGSGGGPDTITGSRGSAPGNTVAVTYANGRVAALSRTDATATITVGYGYDTAGRLARVSEPVGAGVTRVTSFGYDSANRLTRVSVAQDGATRSVAIAYDGASRVSAITQDPGGVNAVTAFGYDLPAGHSRMWDANHARPADNGGVYTDYTDYTADARGRVTRVIDPLGHARASSWTGNDQQATVTDAAGGTYRAGYAAAADSRGNANGPENLISLTDPAGVADTFGYTGAVNTAANPTGAYQPTSTTDGNGATSTFGYDGPGNLTATTDANAATATVVRNPDGTPARAIDPGNRAETEPGLTRCGATGPTDPAPNCTSYRYAAKNLTSVTPVRLPAAAGREPLGVRSLDYDGFGRLRSVTSGRGVTATVTRDERDRVVRVRFSDASPEVAYTYTVDGVLASC